MKAEIKYDEFIYDPQQYPKHFIQMGGDSSNPTWDEYLDGIYDEYKPHIIAIKEAIEKAGLVGKTANQIANDIYFKFEDGVQISYSWRAWGDLMQAIVNKHEGYMTYYM